MALNPWYVGDTYKPFNPTLLFDDGSVPNFTGATAIITFKNSDTGVTWTGQGAQTLSGSSFLYTFSTQDVATPGKYRISAAVTFASGGQQTWDDIPFEVRTP